MIVESKESTEHRYSRQEHQRAICLIESKGESLDFVCPGRGRESLSVDKGEGHQ